MTTTPPSSLSDATLLAETARAAADERRATADLVILLAEVDSRRLYLGLGYSSLFAWCTDALHLSEPAAYSRITAARAARRYPMVFTLLAHGDVTLTTVTLLAAHLTDENHEALLDAARQKSKREIERLIASLVPQPDIASSLRRLPPAVPKPVQVLDESASVSAGVADDDVAAPGVPACPAGHPTTAAPNAHGREGQAPASRAAPPRALVAPLAPDRYLLKITLSADARARLDRARDLLRHVLPSGDPALIVDRALTVLVEQLENSRRAAVRRPRAQPRVSTTRRHVPASIRRAVWTRDDGRCAFVGADGRCRETGWLELHHVIPFARGGPTTTENLELRCRAHNAYAAEREFGARLAVRRTRAPRPAATLSGQSPEGGASG